MIQTCIAASAGLSLAVSPATARSFTQSIVSGSCESVREPRVVVGVTGFKSRVGTLRVQLYGSEPNNFLKRGAWLRRADVPVAPSGALRICFALPEVGHYAVAVRHDSNANGKSDWNDGGGFSGNPKLSLFRLKPSYRQIGFEADAGMTMLRIVLNYRQGLSIRPVNAHRAD